MSAPSSPPPAEPASLARLAGLVMLGSGAIALLGIVVGFAFAGAHVPPVVRYANLGGAVLDVGLATGVMRHRRGAWAFGLSLSITLTIVNLLALPRLLEAGVVGVISVVLAIAQALAGTLLIAGRHEFR